MKRDIEITIEIASVDNCTSDYEAARIVYLGSETRILISKGGSVCVSSQELFNAIDAIKRAVTAFNEV